MGFANSNRGGFMSGPPASMNLAGDVTIGGTLSVTGASTLTGDIAAGNVNMASGKVVTLAAGSLAAPSLRFAGSAAGTGWSAAVADTVVAGVNGTAVSTDTASGRTIAVALAMNADLNMGAGTSVTLDDGTGAASKLPLRYKSSLQSGMYCSTVDQPSIARAGVGGIQYKSTAVEFNTPLTSNSHFTTVLGTRTTAVATQTANYTATTSDTRVAMNDGGGAALTLTLPASPSSGMRLEVWNKGTSALTIGRNGKNINGAASNVSIAAGSFALCYYSSADAAWEIHVMSKAT